MANGGPSYGASFSDGEGIPEMYAIPGVWLVDADGLPRFDAKWMEVMVHEFVHSFSNPLVDAFAPQMERAAARVNAEVQGAMKRQGYGPWKTLLYESMVRAATVRYVLEHSGADAARRLIGQEGSRSFFWIGDLFELLGSYERDRRRYPNLRAFMPEVVEFFNGLPPRLADLRKRYEDSRPTVISMSIQDGVRDVDPALSEIVVRFSRPMSTVDLNSDPRFRMGRFDEARTVLTIPVTLEPERDYAFALRWPNGQSLTSADGIPMKPASLRFRTRASSKAQE